MPTWPTKPEWTDPSSINKGNEYVAADGVTVTDMNAIIKNLIYLYTHGSTEYTDCITFTGESSDFTLKATNKEWDGTVEYSTDHNTWTTWNGTAVSSVDKKLYLRGSGNTKFYTSNGARLSLSARAACSGNIQTLLEYSNPPTSIPTANCYNSMFRECTNLTAAPKLPATTLADRCYGSMFRECTNLTQAPELPATTLTSYCYNGMFRECTNLTQAPELPATTLIDHCYDGMFFGCTSLTTAPELPATTLANGCYSYMFYGCTKLTQAPILPATTLTGSCYGSMFRECTNLTQAPELPATTLTDRCYDLMFYGCTKLAQAPELPATTLTSYCYNGMFNGCTSLKISTTQSSEYPTAWRIPSSGTISFAPALWNAGMLSGTGGTFTSNPSENTTYYGAWKTSTQEDELAGTWVFNDTVNLIPQGVSVNFIDLNKKQFNRIDPTGATMYYGFLDNNGDQDGLMAYGASGWMNTTYKTITITSRLSEVTGGDALLAWLQANATKQS